jgi:hypothetical protein
VSATRRLAELLRAEGGLMGAAVAAGDPPAGEHGPLAAAGPRADGAPERYELLVEAIREGYLQHYGAGRVVRPGDPDLALLAGDRLYAIGIAQLAELGDLEAIAELADLISLVAQAQAEDDPARADALWAAGAAAVGHGGSPALDAAKALARAGADGATAALRAVAPAR